MLDSNRFAEAWEHIKPIAEDSNRPHPAALVIAVEALARTGRPDEAERRLERLALLDPKSPQLPLSKGWVLMGRNNRSEASAIIEAGYAEAKDNPRAEEIGIASAQLLIKFNDLDAASRVCESVAKHGPGMPISWLESSSIRRSTTRPWRRAGSPSTPARSSRPSGPPWPRASSGPPTGPLLKQAVEMGEQARAKLPKNFNVLRLPRHAPPRQGRLL